MMMMMKPFQGRRLLYCLIAALSGWILLILGPTLFDENNLPYTPDHGLRQLSVPFYTQVYHGNGREFHTVDPSNDRGFKCCSAEAEGPNWAKSPIGKEWCPFSYNFLPEECSRLNFEEANEFCASKGGRLCNSDELEGRCATSNGCNFDIDFAWTGNGVNTIVHHGNGRAFDNEPYFEPSDDRGFKCCSDEAEGPNWAKSSLGKEWCPLSYNFLPDECNRVNYQEANEFCASRGGRLCKEEELRGKCAISNGCNFDIEFAWTHIGVEPADDFKKQEINLGATIVHPKEIAMGFSNVESIAFPDGLANMDDTQEPTQLPPIQPYTLLDAINESNMFQFGFAVVVYDPQEDKFVSLYRKNSERVPTFSSNTKMWGSIQTLTYMLRKLFPDRFTKDSPEFAFAIGAGDYPHVYKWHLPHVASAPVLQFGSAFSDPEMYTNMIAMPMPVSDHLKCFQYWLDRKAVCSDLSPKSSTQIRGGGSMLFGDEFGIKWEDLIPQVVWRGTDFLFLAGLKKNLLRSPVPPHSYTFWKKGDTQAVQRAAAIEELFRKYHTLPPRWKGAALTAQAEQEAEGTDKLPWANIRMSATKSKGKPRLIGLDEYKLWEEVDIATGYGMYGAQLAKYKYQIDLGGGGGTTWSGTIEKLAMPGLLFHHETMTKDYIHDRIKPWKHYIPVREDLKDLKEKFDWAESHPEDAKKIADAATEFMRHLATEEGFGQMFEESFVEPLRRVIDAYQPLSTVNPEMTSWKDVVGSLQGKVLPVYECTGFIKAGSCRHLMNSDDFQSAAATS